MNMFERWLAEHGVLEAVLIWICGVVTAVAVVKFLEWLARLLVHGLRSIGVI